MNKKIRKRYIVFSVECKKKLSSKEITNAILNKCLQLYGDFGSSKLNIWVLEDLFDKNRQIGVLSCYHKKIDEIRFALTSINKIKGKKVIFYIKGVAGTINSAKKKFL